MRFTLVISVMRKPMLKQVLQYYRDLSRDFIERIVVIDYDDEFSERLRLYEPLDGVPHLKLAVKAEPFFNKSRALNLGVAFARAEHVILCDADVLIKVETLRTWQRAFGSDDGRFTMSPRNMIETADGLVRKAPGIVAITPRDYQEISGYCSDYIGWGIEDLDFLWRLQAVGIKMIETGSADHISHDEVERTRNYPLVDGRKEADALHDRLRMRERNLRLFDERKRAVVTTGTLYEDLTMFGLERLLMPGARTATGDTLSTDLLRAADETAGAVSWDAGANKVELRRLASRATV